MGTKSVWIRWPFFFFLFGVGERDSPVTTTHNNNKYQNKNKKFPRPYGSQFHRPYFWWHSLLLGIRTRKFTTVLRSNYHVRWWVMVAFWWRRFPHPPIRKLLGSVCGWGCRGSHSRADPCCLRVPFVVRSLFCLSWGSTIFQGFVCVCVILWVTRNPSPAPSRPPARLSLSRSCRPSSSL